MDYHALLARFARCDRVRLVLQRAGLATQAKIGADLLRQGCGVALVVGNLDELSAARALLTLFSADLSSAETLPDFRYRTWGVLPPFTTRTVSRTAWAERMAVLYALRYGRSRGLVLYDDNLWPRLIPLIFFEGKELLLKQGEDVPPDMVLDQAVTWGYERVSIVANPGEVARRGDILDIMPPGHSRPLRFEFFGDVIEEIRIFDSATQRSRADISEALILPVQPVLQDALHRKQREEYWNMLQQKELLTDNEFFGLTRLDEQGNPCLLPGACYTASSVVEDWLPQNTVWLMPGHYEFEDALLSAERHWAAAFAEQDAAGRPQPQRLHMRTPEEVTRTLAETTAGIAEPLVAGVEISGHDMPERAIASFAELFPSVMEQDRPWQTLVHALKAWQRSKRQTLLCFSGERSRNKFLKLAEQDGLFPALRYDPVGSGLFALMAPFRGGADMLWDEVIVLGEDVLQPHTEKSRRIPSGAFRGLDRYDELEPGDLLVHRDYGIARFGGLIRMEMGDTSNDFLLLYYANDDRLYVPVDRLSLIQRFKGGGETPPTLDHLGGGSWQASKEKARKAIEKIAEDLVEMYAWRKVAKGFRYPPVEELYREFEASFGFDETPDQARAIQDVLTDMEKPVPMDRLVCGDVGFGKTEVALRAAFRAAAAGRQVALLCPTTILAEQHYQTFRSRLSRFAINVGLLSRFVANRQKEIIKAAASGQIDVLIGTHRLLSDDVSLPNLGLLILDEEQRFGVRHKEKLKKIKKNVDVLALTATPIPRTLQLSMSGVRELSVIETAPPERKPVSTCILERDKNALRSIVERELARKGQVFWVYNRVQGLERVVDFVRDLVPQAHIGMAHGQMPENKLEETMHAFWHGELDILVCTAIIESGLDFPRANTLIVDQAQMFGLGQLYQLRGRVGRSDRQAFACFVVSDLDRLPKVTRDRLRIILDLDYLGAGFQIAMEDLRLRGAGNILGEVQSGHMSRIGLDMYLEMLEQAVNRIRGDGCPLQTETELNLALTAHIPETYIADGRERLRWYKRLSSAIDTHMRQELELELRDRFGPLPEELRVFMAVLELKQFLSLAQVVRADVHPDHLRIVWEERQTVIAPERLLAFLQAQAGNVKFSPPATLDIKLDGALSIPNRLNAVRLTLGTLTEDHA